MQADARYAYCALVMMTFWTLNIVPFMVTSMIPLLALPLLNVMSALDMSSYIFSVRSLQVKTKDSKFDGLPLVPVVFLGWLPTFTSFVATHFNPFWHVMPFFFRR